MRPQRLELAFHQVPQAYALHQALDVAAGDSNPRTPQHRVCHGRSP